MIASITDAGTPGISDPGEDIVRICYEEGIEVTSLPGAAACVTKRLRCPDFRQEDLRSRLFAKRISGNIRQRSRNLQETTAP
ncbi:MAG: hypothetical protein ACLR78_01555 [Roseburia sp.]